MHAYLHTVTVIHTKIYSFFGNRSSLQPAECKLILRREHATVEVPVSRVCKISFHIQSASPLPPFNALYGIYMTNNIMICEKIIKYISIIITAFLMMLFAPSSLLVRFQHEK